MYVQQVIDGNYNYIILNVSGNSMEEASLYNRILMHSYNSEANLMFLISSGRLDYSADALK